MSYLARPNHMAKLMLLGREVPTNHLDGGGGVDTCWTITQTLTDMLCLPSTPVSGPLHRLYR